MMRSGSEVTKDKDHHPSQQTSAKQVTIGTLGRKDAYTPQFVSLVTVLISLAVAHLAGSFSQWVNVIMAALHEPFYFRSVVTHVPKKEVQLEKSNQRIATQRTTCRLCQIL